MREVVYQADGNASEDRLALLLADILLKLDQAVRHVVEGIAELPELVVRRDDHALVEMARRQRLGSARERHDWRNEASTPEVTDREHGEQRKTDGNSELVLEADRDRKGFRDGLFHHDDPAERGDACAAAKHLAALVPVLLRAGGHALGHRLHLREDRVLQHGVAACHAGLRVRVAVCQEEAVACDDEGVAAFADTDAVDHPPHLLKIQAPDEPLAVLCPVESDCHDRGGQQVHVVDREARHQGALDVDPFRAGHTDGGLAEAARDGRTPVLIEQRQLAILGKLEDEVLQDAVLLPALEACLLQVGGYRFEDLDAADHVQLDLLGRAAGDVDVPLDDGLLGAGP